MRNAVQQSIANPTTTSDALTSHPFINTVDLYPSFKPLYTSEAIKVLNTQTRNMIHQRVESNHPWSHLYGLIELAALLGIKSAEHNPCEKFFDRKLDIVMCFGYTCFPHQVGVVANDIVQHTNDMASNKLITASLYNLGMFELGKLDPNDPDRVVVFSYLAVPTEHEDYVKQTYSFMQFPEGGMPPEFK